MFDTAINMPYMIRIAAYLSLSLLISCSDDNTIQPSTGSTGSSQPSATYIGGKQCIQCHEDQHTLWTNSHHDLAMQVATVETVMGDFKDTTFSIRDQKTRFFKEGERFMVETEDADGNTGIFEIKYTFGVTPLQQYLVDYGEGRFQALGVAWDSRPAEEGGQRWFHLYPDYPPLPGSSLHWTGIDQNWNYQCAECHSTRLTKNYNPEARSFNTQWSEINVACEACHGPGSNHVAWANKTEGWEQIDNLGLGVLFDARKDSQWLFDDAVTSAKRSQPIAHQHETETCARCHSRRGIQSEDFIHGKSILDTHRVSRLSDGLYYPDGQIREEVYVYGSFLQSRMYHEGVTCSDCHEPHSLKLRAEGDGVCYQCHKAEHFATEKHHFHQSGSEGSSCVDCHMPETTYMVIDPRRDHSIRIPRPDLSVKLGVPNACNRCHIDEDQQWAAHKLNEWYGGTPEGDQDHAMILAEARKGNPAVIPDLERLIKDARIPAIIRATLIDELTSLGGATSQATIIELLKDESPLVRQAAAEALSNADSNVQYQYVLPLLDDPVQGVRIEAVKNVSSLPQELLTTSQRQALNKAQDEYRSSLRINADRPEAQTEMALLSLKGGNSDQAEAHYREAIRLDPTYVPAYVNWADLQYRLGNEQRGVSILNQGLEVVPGNADLSHALGLAYVRKRDYPTALAALASAAENAPDNVRYQYVYGVALQSTGKLTGAIKVLEVARQKHPYNQEILSALVSYYQEAGDQEKAKQAYSVLQKLTR